MADWYISLDPLDPRIPDDLSRGTAYLEVLPEGSTREDAIEALEGWAETINRLGHVPDGLDWANRSPAAILRRRGRLSFQARVDCYEFETENGYSNGYALLRAVER